MTTHKPKNDHTYDPKYNEKVGKLDKNLYELEERYDKKSYEAKEHKDNAQSWLKDKWKEIKTDYHDMVKYIKEKFSDDDHEDTVKPRMNAVEKRMQKAGHSVD